MIVPVYGQTPTTLACLRSLSAVPAERSFEVIVVEDCSPDAETRVALREVDGIMLIENDVNLGFIGASNRGLQEARGRFICFLNNDTTVTNGWLDALLQTFEDHPMVGLVGPRLLFPDGRIQEAGGVVCRDASCEHFGRSTWPGPSRYAFVRPTDYVSAACAVIPKELCDELGGFDTTFSPAYYEDTDLAFRVRKAGRKVLYQPAARVFHHEGVTHGRDTTQGLKRHQILNREVFRERWRAKLQAEHPGPMARSPDAADRRRGPRLLFLTASNDDPAIDIARQLASWARPAWWAPSSTLAFRESLGAQGVEPLGPIEAPNLACAIEWAREADGVVLGTGSVEFARRLQVILPNMPVLATEGAPPGARALLGGEHGKTDLPFLRGPLGEGEGDHFEAQLWATLRRR